MGVFKNVRLSHEELPMEPLKPLDLLDPLDTSNPADYDSPYHASVHRNLNPYSSSLPSPTLDSDAKATSPPALSQKQDGDEISEQSTLMPSGGSGMQPGPLGMGQNEQLIYNVSPY